MNSKEKSRLVRFIKIDLALIFIKLSKIIFY